CACPTRRTSDLEAPVRILLLADARARLERRARELHGTADAEAIAATRDQVERRDADDSTVSNFTTAADGVVTVDTSTLTLDEAVATVRAVITAADESPRTQEQQ